MREIKPNNSSELNQSRQELEVLKKEKLRLEEQVGNLHKKLEVLSTQNTLILAGGGILIIILVYLLFGLSKKKRPRRTNLDIWIIRKNK